MELKLYSDALDNVGRYGFNRTFMELKFQQPNLPGLHYNVLIVPLWNWNWDLQRWWHQTTVLIVPLWNWNNWTSEYCECFCYVLIVPLWNWNLQVTILSNNIKKVLIVPLWNWNDSWQRTLWNGQIVLIVPLWNWNERDAREAVEQEAF